MNNYLKNFAIWLGGGLALNLVIWRMGVGFPFSYWVLMIGGMIVSIVMTHRDEGKQISFSKAFGAMAIFIGGFFILNLLIFVLEAGLGTAIDFVFYFQEDVIFDFAIGTSILLAAGQWYMFEKAGKPGWACMVPIYNIVIWCEIAKKPGWWVAMIFVPIANIVFLIMILNGISKNFGKDGGFTVGLVFLQQIFMAILGYGDAKYLGAQELDGDPEILDSGSRYMK